MIQYVAKAMLGKLNGVVAKKSSHEKYSLLSSSTSSCSEENACTVAHRRSLVFSRKSVSKILRIKNKNFLS